MVVGYAMAAQLERDFAARLARREMNLVWEGDVVGEEVELAAVVPGVLGQPKSSRLKPDLACGCWTTWQ